MNDVAERVQALGPSLIALSHALHADPETAFDEYRSAAKLTAFLRSSGFTVDVGVAGLATAFIASAGTGPTTVGLFAEYDSLPGLGHACGHNIIAAASVGAAIALAPLVDELGLSVKVIGSPGEEGGGGKIILLDAGALDDLDLAMMIHPGPADSAYARPFAVAHFDVVYEGKSSHAAAYPHLGVNAADAATIAQVAIGLLRQQLPATVKVHGIVASAGSAPNAIPDRAVLRWYVRAGDLDQLDDAFIRIRACFEAGAMATGCAMTLTETSPRYSSFRNDGPLLESFARHAAVLGRDMDLSEADRGGMNTASTDMANVSQRFRAIHPYLSIDSLPAVNHQPEFAEAAITQAADTAILDGATLLASTVVDECRRSAARS